MNGPFTKVQSPVRARPKRTRSISRRKQADNNNNNIASDTKENLTSSMIEAGLACASRYVILLLLLFSFWRADERTSANGGASCIEPFRCRFPPPTRKRQNPSKSGPTSLGFMVRAIICTSCDLAPSNPMSR